MTRRVFLLSSSLVLSQILFPMHVKAGEHLEELTFSEVYPKSFWRKSYFGWVIMAASIVAAGVASYFTAGAGAPVAASGVSTVASWIGGGGAGSYMAGLSTVGSMVGGNAMVGAAILNGISLGTIGIGGTKAALTVATKVAISTDIMLSGIAYVKNIENNKAVYVVDVKIPRELGSGRVRKLIENIYEAEEEKNEAIEDKKFLKAQQLQKLINKYYKQGADLLFRELDYDTPSLENLFVLGLMAYKIGEMELFKKALEKIEKEYGLRLKKRSFLDYLWGIYILSIDTSKNSLKRASDYFWDAYLQEKYVIEPILLLVEIEEQLKGDSADKMKLIESLVQDAEENFDSDEYDGKDLLSLYYKVGSIALRNQEWKMGLKYFQKAYDELGVIGKILPIGDELKKNIKLNIAICHNNLGNMKDAKDYLNEALDYCENQQCEEEILKIFKES